jgi:hypothetical protein
MKPELQSESTEVPSDSNRADRSIMSPMSPRPRHQCAYKDTGKSVRNQTLRIKIHFTTGALVAVMVTDCLIYRMRRRVWLKHDPF